MEILANLRTVMERAFDEMVELGLQPQELKTIGITNQRETTVAWNRKTGKPYMNAIVWSDTRTVEVCRDHMNRVN
jgi:glycerol kinase